MVLFSAMYLRFIDLEQGDYMCCISNNMLICQLLRISNASNGFILMSIFQSSASSLMKDGKHFNLKKICLYL